MRTFTEKDIANYWKFVYENLFDKELAHLELDGRCHTCGLLLSETELPEGVVSEVCCNNCLGSFVEQFEELESENFYL